MAIDPRMIGSGIQMGRSLAPQGPPIQEMLGMQMQQRQGIMDFMKELLKTHSSDISDLRKMQMSSWVEMKKAAAQTTPGQSEQRDFLNREADNIWSWDLTNQSMMSRVLKGGTGGKDPGAAAGNWSIMDFFRKKSPAGTPAGGGVDMLSGLGNMGKHVAGGINQSLSSLPPVASPFGQGNTPPPGSMNTPPPNFMGGQQPSFMGQQQQPLKSPYAEYPDAFQESGVWKVIRNGNKYRIED